QLAEELAVPALDRLRLGLAQRPPHLAPDRADEEPAAHADAAVDLPAVDRHPGLVERPLPREHVRVDGVGERAVEVEDQRLHPRPWPWPNQTTVRRDTGPKRTCPGDRPLDMSGKDGWSFATRRARPN